MLPAPKLYDLLSTETIPFANEKPRVLGLGVKPQEMQEVGYKLGYFEDNPAWGTGKPQVESTH